MLDSENKVVDWPLALNVQDNVVVILQLRSLFSQSIVQSGDVEPAKACLVGNHADLGDLAIHNREFENEYRLIQMTRDDACRSVHERRIHAAPGTIGELLGLIGHGL
ncbi:hypothetical protein [Paenibacillus sp. LPE1-1-1.1]|uniref:hypothetical protein n=1 Tax=Paenibacillus sp. LPE1-1-1.1 TaxID=3135230 RepID=UPI00342A0B75